MATIAWIGLGRMGTPMTANLVRAGHSVRGYDLLSEARTAAATNGVTIVESIAEALDRADVVFTMLPEGRHVKDVFSGPDGIWANADRDTLLIDSSTIDIETSRFLHEESSQHGFDFIDAPVSGGISGAAAGTLAFMLGGSDDDALLRAGEYIAPMSGNTVVVGGPTMGIATKIVNNMMLFINVLAAAEGAHLAERIGIDPKTFWEVVSSSSGRSWAQQTWYPVPGIIDSAAANNNFDATFTADLALKDVRLALAAGEAAGVHLAAARLAEQQFQQLASEGLGHKDCSLVIKHTSPDGAVTGYIPEGKGVTA